MEHGFCTHTYFETCPHRMDRMACARCPFYLPKDSCYGQCLELRAYLNRRRQCIEVSDAERAAVEGYRDAITRLCERLADIPTPFDPV
jgi:hypothetical protein